MAVDEFGARPTRRPTPSVPSRSSPTPSRGSAGRTGGYPSGGGARPSAPSRPSAPDDDDRRPSRPRAGGLPPFTAGARQGMGGAPLPGAGGAQPFRWPQPEGPYPPGVGAPTGMGGGAPAGGGEAFGPFGSFDQWAAQYEQEHGRPPGEQDVYDAIDSFNFLAMTGRAPTDREWRNRYYTGAWSGSGGGYGGGGGGGGYGGGGYPQQPMAWSPGNYFWNIR